MRSIGQTRRLLWMAAATAVLGLAVANLVGGVGRSSLFVDEAFSWIVASHPLSGLYAQVKLSEVAPPGYYLLLHLWLQIGGSMTETWMRSLSVIAGLALVAAVSWLCHLLAGRRAALIGGLLTAVSPLVLTYAQQVRAYVFVMLATTLAVALAIKAVEAHEYAHRWLAGSAALAVCAIWLHYTCLGVVIALVVWVITRPEFSGRAKGAYVLVCAVAQALVTPLLIHQASTGNPGADAYSHLTVTNAFDVLGNPVDGQYASHLAVAIIATAAILAAAAVLLTTGPRSSVTWLTIAAALVPVIALFAITIVAKPVLITRYCTVATPFAIATLSVACARAPRLGAVPVLAVMVGAVLGSSTVHEPVSRWPDVGAAYRVAGAHWRAGDAFVLNTGIDPVLTSAPLIIYYTQRYLPAGVQPVNQATHPELQQLIRRRRRIWILGPPYSVALTNRILRPSHYTVALARLYRTDEWLQLTLINQS